MPRVILPDSLVRLFPGAERRREARTKASALGSEGTPWDIAYGAVYLCSDEARWVTGITLNIDGGVLVN